MYQAAIVANTPSKEKIIAAGAGVIFFYNYTSKNNMCAPE